MFQRLATGEPDLDPGREPEPPFGKKKEEKAGLKSTYAAEIYYYNIHILYIQFHSACDSKYLSSAQKQGSKLVELPSRPAQ